MPELQQNPLLDALDARLAAMIKAEQPGTAQQPKQAISSPVQATEMGTNVTDSGMFRAAATPVLNETPQNFNNVSANETPVEQPKPEYAWWEKPAELGNWAVGTAGNLLAKTPIVSDVLKSPVVYKPLQGISWLQDLTNALIFAPLWAQSPEGQAFMNEQNKSAESTVEAYRAWKAPTYLKFGLDIINPISIGLFAGWVWKGAIALSAGAKVMEKVGTTVIEDVAPDVLQAALAEGGESLAGKVLGRAAGELTMQTTDQLAEQAGSSLFKRMIAPVANKNPMLKSVIEAVKGRSFFLQSNPQTPMDFTENAIAGAAAHGYTGGQILDQAAKNPLLAAISKSGGDLQELFQVDKEGFSKAVEVLPEFAGVVAPHVSEVIASPQMFKWLSPQARATVDQIWRSLDTMREFAIQNGTEIPDITKRFPDILHYFPRIATGEMTQDGFEKIIGGSSPFARIVFEHVQDGIAQGVTYDGDIMGLLDATQNSIVRKVTNNLLAGDLKKIGVNAVDRWMEYDPELATQYSEKLAKDVVLNKLENATKNLLPAAGQTIGRPIRANYLNNLGDYGMGDLADQIRQVQKVKVRSPEKWINSFSGAIRMQLTNMNDVSYEILQKRLSGLADNVTPENVQSIINEFASTGQDTEYLTELIYKSAARGATKDAREAVKNLVSTIKDRIASERELGQPIEASVNAAKDMMRQKAVEKGIGYLPQLRGYIFPQSVSNEVNKVLGERGNEWLKLASNASGAIRTATATADFSPLLITSGGVFGRNPVAWVKGAIGFVKALQDPGILYGYGEQNKSIILDMIQRGGSADIGDMFAGQGLISKVLGRTATAQTLGRLQNATRMLSLVSKVELYKAGIAEMTAKGIVGAAADEYLGKLAKSVDLITGNFSSVAAGIPVNNRLFESAFGLFSPSYTRAALSLMGNVVRGDIAGSEARKTMGGMMVGGMAMYAAATAALGQKQELDPTSSKFMTIEIGNRRVGIGGVYTAMLRMLSETAVDMAKGIGEVQAGKPPESFGKLNPLNISRLDNPFYRFIYSRSAPLTGTINELAFEHGNYLGQPFESWQDYAYYMANKVLPLSVSAILPDQEKAYMNGMNRPAVFAANVAGLREFPKSPSELRDEARDNLAVNKYNSDYNSLNQAQKKEINSIPQVATLINEAEKIVEKRGNKVSLASIHYNDEVALIKEQRDNMVKQLADAANQTRDYQWFKDKINDVETQYINNYQYLASKPEYKSVFESYNDPNKPSPLKREDIAYTEWAKTMYGGGETRWGEMENKFGEPNYANQERFRAYFEQKWGADILKYVEQDRPLAGRGELPPLYLELKQAKIALKPYWAVQTNYEETLGKPITKSQINRENATVSRIREKMLRANPQLNYYYSKFYRAKAF